MNQYGWVFLFGILGLLLWAWSSRFKRKADTVAPPVDTPAEAPANTPPPEVLPPPAPADTGALSTRLHQLEPHFAPYGQNAAHPSDLIPHPQFREAVRLLADPAVSFDTVLRYAEGANWALSCAALQALAERPDGALAVEPVLVQCTHIGAWPMYFALELFTKVEPRPPVGAPLVGARDWWAENPYLPLFFRDYFARREALGDAPEFGNSRDGMTRAPATTVVALLNAVNHPFAAEFSRALADEPAPSASSGSPLASGPLSTVGRFWADDQDNDVHVEPAAWRRALAAAEATLRGEPSRSLLISGERLSGKTALLRLLAKRIEADGWRVFEAGGADLMAGQIYIGQLEGRIREVLDALQAGGKVIWYIPDILQLARSGTHQGQSASMLDQITPAIAAGRLTVWCEATPAAVGRLTQLKPSLRSLLEIVALEPLSPADTLTLTRDTITAIESATDIRFAPGCAEIALDTARQYLGAASLPGAPLLVLKLTATRVENAKEPIAPRQVVETLSQLSGLPVSILDSKERIDLDEIRAFFRARVIGQDEAVDTVVERIAMLKAGLNDPGKPIGVFLFAGPTGTGKTELAKAAANFLFGSADRLIRLDMSEFQTPDSMGKILGSAGGSFEADSLIDRVRKQPFSVLLLDEFEKAHPNIWDLFLQVFDEGRLSDAIGQVTDFRHCLIILTSNLGATAHRSLGLGFAPAADTFTTEQIMRAIAQTYRPEFQNRLDKVIVFRPLTRDLMRGILKKELASLMERRGLKDRQWAIEWEASALEFLLEKGFTPEMGARPLKRAIDQHVLAPLAALIVEQRLPEGERFVFVRSDGNAVQAEFVDPDGDAATAEGGEQPASGSALTALILAPQAQGDAIATLGGELAGIDRTLASAEWERLKATLAAEMAATDFWERPDRFATLSRFALMDRVKAAAETAQSLRARLDRRKPSADLVGRLALQLHLVKEGIRDTLDDAPVEIALSVEPVLEGGADREAVLAWARRLTDMYRAWGTGRRMQLLEIGGAGDGRAVLVVSGFGAGRALVREAGLHVFEPSEGSTSRVAARVCHAVVPPGELPAAKMRKTILTALEKTPRGSTIVRRYRQTPPLVRDGSGTWRSGRLDLVLAGDFDLLQPGESG